MRIFISERSVGKGWRSLEGEISSFLLGSNMVVQKKGSRFQLVKVLSKKEKERYQSLVSMLEENKRSIRFNSISSNFQG